MKFRLLLCIAIAAIIAFTGSHAVAGGTESGAMCRAANLNQAFLLAWDHNRVNNNANIPLWVICPVRSELDAIDYGGTPANGIPASWIVTAWFGASASSSAEVLCTWRGTVHNYTGTAATRQQSLSVTAPAMLPGSDTMTFFDADISLPIIEFQTITCRLDPDTGINNIYHANIYPSP